MILGENTRVVVCIEPQDMRRGFDRLAQAVKAELGEDPRSGVLFVFVGRRGDRLKILWWDTTGYAVLYKRLHQATTRAPKPAEPSQRTVEINVKRLAVMMRGEARTPRRGPARERS